MSNYIDENEREFRQQWDNSGQSRTSGSSLNIFKIDGGGIAIAFSLMALGGVLVAAILIPDIIEARAAEAAAKAEATANYANRDARVALDKIGYVQLELAKKGIHISTDGH